MKSPEGLVTVSFWTPVPSSLSWTVAPGTTPSEVSRTVPLMLPLTLTWAAAGPAHRSRAAHAISQAAGLRM